MMSCMYIFILIPTYYINLHHKWIHVGPDWLRKQCSWLAINDSRDHDHYLFLSTTSTMPRTSQKARKSTGAPAKKCKTLKPCSPSIQTKDLMTSKRSRTSDAADKVDPKRACIVVNFQLLYHSAANSSSIKSRILMSKRSISNVKPNLAIGSRTTLGIWPWNCSGAIWSNFPTPC